MLMHECMCMMHEGRSTAAVGGVMAREVENAVTGYVCDCRWQASVLYM